MKTILLNNLEFYTNISDSAILERCKAFFSSGCMSKIVSLSSNESELYQTIEKNQKVALVSELNKNAYFGNKKAKILVDLHSDLEPRKLGNKLLENGYDLIKLL